MVYRRLTSESGVFNMSDRQRVWAFLVYPESAPEDWLCRLSDSHIPAAVSPLHDRDLAFDEKIVFPDKKKNEIKLMKYKEIIDILIEKGILEYKKPHYHVLINYSGVKSYDQVAELSHFVAGTLPIAIDEIGGYARYLIHEDDPDKFHYYKQDVISLSGFDYDGYFEMSKSKAYHYLREISFFIVDKDIREFADLHDYCLTQKPEWYYVLMSCYTSSLKEVIKSRRNKLKMLEQMIIDQDGQLCSNKEDC